MLYKNDINYFKPKQLTFHQYILQKLEKPTIIKHRKHYQKTTSSNILISSLWRRYCNCTPVHGIRYLTDDTINRFERIIWALILMSCAIGTVYTCILLSSRYQHSGLQTVVSSTIYPVYYIRFPAVTICNYNRINWSKIVLAEKKFLPTNTSNGTVQLFRQFFSHFDTFEFGKFDLFEKFINISLNELDFLNITEVIEFVSYTCEDLFLKYCSWNRKLYLCCEIFVQQKSEIGYCLTFNSMTNSIGKFKHLNDKYYPWHMAKAGLKSALLVELKLDTNNLSDNGADSTNGLSIVIHDSYCWPFGSEFLPGNSNVFVTLEPKSTYAEIDTKDIEPTVRECLFEDQAETQTQYKTLPGLRYMKSNCISQCHQQHLVNLCNCTIELFFPIGNFTPCKASDFHCLASNHDTLSSDKTSDQDNYINVAGKGMICPCLLECDSIDYIASVFPLHMDKKSTDKNTSYINIDVHYHKNTLMRYKTNIIYGWLDLMSAFGGIAGLFMGCSLFTGAELLYYILFGWIMSLIGTRNSSIKKITEIGKKY